MPVSLHSTSGSIWFETTSLDGGPNTPICTIWDDGEVILETSEYGGEHIYPTLEEWEYLAQVVDTNIERLRKESSGD